MSYSVGDTVVLDGIESIIIYDNGSEADWGRYICVDKNHDLSYYISGSDYLNELENSSIINSANKYGYEWGGYGVTTGVTSKEIGSGLNNTNSLISLNLQPYASGWKVLWDCVETFRSSYSNEWFIPSRYELLEIYNQRSYLKNLSISTSPYYWSSSERDSTGAYYISLMEGLFWSDLTKNYRKQRSRLCRYTTDQELNSKTIQITSTTDQASIYYTIDNSTPTSNSTLYNNTFQVQTGTTIKAIGIKEGYINSDIATLTV